MTAHTGGGRLGLVHEVSAPPTRAAWPRFARIALGALCLLSASGLAGVAMAGRPPPPPPPEIEVRLGGEVIPADAEPSEVARRFASRWENEPFVLDLRGESAIEGTRGSLGGRIDVDALSASIAQAIDQRSLMRRLHVQVRSGGPLIVPVPIALDSVVLMPALLARKDELDVPPNDARLEPRSGRVLPERPGLSLDVHGTLDDIMAALARGEPGSAIRVRTQEPRRTARELESASFDATLGTFETRYSTLADMAARTHNLRLAARRIDGSVLMPGEVFDFNEVVGERSEANGFQAAPEIAAGELVDGIGGGACQIAGTLHAAAFFAGLPIVERSPHSRPSTYIFMGLDAVVVYGRLNLRFRNDLPFPIALGMTVEGGVVRAEIRGARQERMVSFLRRIEEIAPFRVREEPDPSLPREVRVLRQRGVPGFRTTRFRIIRDVVRNHARRERLEDSYPPTDAIIRVGSSPEASPPDHVAPEGDDHPEYTADEYLVVTQGAGVEGTEMTRRGGRATSAGWTESYARRE